ncbi:hypothetical protein JW930_05575 [Candidatus Woesearchaeota archaeon]|nr:hypothetical protein [Candidatus Woesearchaeota archaeon]
MKKKGQVWVSAILYTLVAAMAIVIILQTGIPILSRFKDQATFTKTKDVMLNLDKHITEIAREGEGSQRVVTIDITDGKLIVDNNQIVWELETKNKLIDPRTSQIEGNLIITSNANVQTIETDNDFIMQTQIKNDTFSVNISKIGSRNNWMDINTSSLLNYISFNDNMMNGTFNFSLNYDPSSTSGNGYTEMIPSGNNSNLGKAKVVAHINSSFAEYELEFVLESYADFLIARVKNFVPKS